MGAVSVTEDEGTSTSGSSVPNGGGSGPGVFTPSGTVAPTKPGQTVVPPRAIPPSLQQGPNVTVSRPNTGPTVYWGYSVPTGGVSVNGNTYYSSPRPVATTDNAAIDAWTSLSVEQQAEIEKIAKLQHYGREGSTLWGEAITAVSNLRAQGINMTPWQWLSQYAAQWQDQPATSTTSGGGGYGSGGGSSSSVALTNRFDARALVDSALNAYLGRDATPKERERFWKQLNSQEMANPRTAEMQGNVAVGSGGFNSQVFAEDYAKSLDDYAETQAGAVLMDYFKGLVKNAGSERIV